MPLCLILFVDMSYENFLFARTAAVSLRMCDDCQVKSEITVPKRIFYMKSNEPGVEAKAFYYTNARLVSVIYP